MKACFHISTVTCPNCEQFFVKTSTITDVKIPDIYKTPEVKEQIDGYQEYLDQLSEILKNKPTVNRLAPNLEIAALITQAVIENPDLRFGQILTMLNITKDGEPGSWVNEFYLESKDLLERIKDE